MRKVYLKKINEFTFMSKKGNNLSILFNIDFYISLDNNLLFVFGVHCFHIFSRGTKSLSTI